ncbi:DUF6231 family protein [Gammaproteobacteria bacterium]|nr:DUF6231 family protein [Gammaproteobacteria bacterium]
MISAQNKIIQSFLSDVIEDETCKSMSLISSADSSELVKFLEKKNLEQLFILPQIDNNLNIQSDLYVVCKDVEFSVSDIGIIKNLLSQKIIIFKSHKDKFINDSDLLKLGFQKEFENKDLIFFAYNLKTYNNKREWNNSKGWANPENFDKFRW